MGDIVPKFWVVPEMIFSRETQGKKQLLAWIFLCALNVEREALRTSEWTTYHKQWGHLGLFLLIVSTYLFLSQCVRDTTQ